MILLLKPLALWIKKERKRRTLPAGFGSREATVPPPPAPPSARRQRIALELSGTKRKSVHACVCVCVCLCLCVSVSVHGMCGKTWPKPQPKTRDADARRGSIAARSSSPADADGTAPVGLKGRVALMRVGVGGTDAERLLCAPARKTAHGGKKFSKFSALEHLLYKVPIESTLENLFFPAGKQHTKARGGRV